MQTLLALSGTDGYIRHMKDLPTSAQFSPHNAFHQSPFGDVPFCCDNSDLIPPVNEFLNKDHVEVKDSSEMRDDRDRESGDNLLKSVKSLPSNLDENAIQKEEREETESNKDEDILFSSSEIVSLSAKDKDDAQEIEKPSSTLKSQVTFKTEETSHDVSRDVMNDTTKQQREPEAIETQTQGFNKQQTRSNTETNARRNVLYRRTISENLGAERKRWSSSEPGNEECNRSVSSPLVSKTMTSLPSSRPELSEVRCETK